MSNLIAHTYKLQREPRESKTKYDPHAHWQWIEVSFPKVRDILMVNLRRVLRRIPDLVELEVVNWKTIWKAHEQPPKKT